MTGKSKAFFEAKGGNYIDTTTSSNESHDSRIGHSDTSLRETLNSKGEQGLYDNKKFEFDENPLYEFAIRYLAATLADFQISGPGTENVNTYMDDTNPTFRQELYSCLVSAIKDGTGFLLKYRNTEKVVKQMKWESTHNYELEWVHRIPKEDESEKDATYDKDAKKTDNRHVKISVRDPDADAGDSEDGDSNSQYPSYYMRECPLLEPDDYIHDKIAMLRLLLDDSFPTGRAIGRSCYQHFKNLNQALKSVMGAIEKLMGTPLFAALDLNDVDDTEATDGTNPRADAMQTFKNSLKGINWNESDVITFDQRHKLGYGGIIEGQSATGDTRIIDIMTHIEPVLSAVLLNYFIPLGLVEQTGANKSIIAQQTLQARKDMKPIQQAFSAFLRTQIFRDITKEKVKISFAPLGVSYEMWDAFWASGLVSQEYVTEKIGIVDHGKKFVPIKAPMATGGKEGGDSHDDNPTKKRQESQGTKKGETGT